MDGLIWLISELGTSCLPWAIVTRQALMLTFGLALGARATLEVRHRAVRLWREAREARRDRLAAERRHALEQAHARELLREARREVATLRSRLETARERERRRSVDEGEGAPG